MGYLVDGQHVVPRRRQTRPAALDHNKCLDAYNAGTANGTQTVLWSCNGQANQKWTLS